MLATVISRVVLCIYFLATTGSAGSDHLRKGDPFAICLNKNTNSIARQSKLSCDAGSVPAFFQGMSRKGLEDIEVKFQSNPDDGGHPYNLKIKCPASQTVTKTVTARGSTSTVTSTSTTEKMETITKRDCTITQAPSPKPTYGRLCQTGNAACVNMKENFSSAIGCDEGYREKGCLCIDTENRKFHEPRCNGVGQVVCNGCK